MGTRGGEEVAKIFPPKHEREKERERVRAAAAAAATATEKKPNSRPPEAAAFVVGASHAVTKSR